MLDSNGGMQSAHGVSLYPAGLPAAVSFGLRAQELPQGNAGQLDGNGGMQSAHGVTL